MSEKTLDELRGIGDATLAKLESIGITTVEALAFATSRELEQVGILKDAPKMIMQAQDLLATSSYVPANVILEQRKNMQKLTTGSCNLDKLTLGGLETKNITEVYGEFGSAKTQFAKTLCVTVQLPEDQGGLNGGALYVDSEASFRPERICEIAQARGLDPDAIIKRIILAEAYNSDHQCLILEKADKVIKENNIKLVIVDSIMSHFRSEYQGRENLPPRQQRLNRHLHQLMRLARMFNLVGFITNQVIANPQASFIPGLDWDAAGGHVLKHTPGLRLKVRKAGANMRVATVVDSSFIPWSEATFMLDEKGVDDPPPDKEKKAEGKP